MTILERITPLDLAAHAAISGIHIAMVPEFDRNEDMTVQQITTTIVNRRSFFASELVLILMPILLAMPVLKRASPTTIIPATIITVELEKPDRYPPASFRGG